MKNAFLYVPIIIVAFVLLMNALLPPLSARDARSPESKLIPLLPNEVEVVGTASSPTDYSADYVWFRTRSDGTFKTESFHTAYHPVLTRWEGNQFAIMRGDSIVVTDLDTDTTTNIPAGTDSSGMDRGYTSPNGRFIALVSHSGGKSVTLSDGERTSTKTIASFPEDIGVSDEGRVYILEMDSTGYGKPLCVRTFALDEKESISCVLPEISRSFGLGVMDASGSVPRIFTLQASDSADMWVTYEWSGNAWVETGEGPAASYDTEEFGRAADWFAYGDQVYILTTTPGWLSFPFPGPQTSDLQPQYTPLEHIAPGYEVTHTVDGEIATFVFYRDEGVASGQYVTAFNINDPTVHVGPWELPPELYAGSKATDLNAIDSLFIVDERTRAKLVP